jgi:hypothetical protein
MNDHTKDLKKSSYKKKIGLLLLLLLPRGQNPSCPSVYIIYYALFKQPTGFEPVTLLYTL